MIESRARFVVEAVVPTACLPQALGTRASTTPRQPWPLQLLRSLLDLFSVCVNPGYLRIQKSCLFAQVDL